MKIIKKNKKKGLIGNIGDRLEQYIKQYSRLSYESQIYDENNRKLDLSKLIPPKELAKLLSGVASSNIFGQTMFEKFFELSVGRLARYTEYEQILNRIPEASQALQIYVDSILSPNVGNRENQVEFNIAEESDSCKRAKNLLEIMLKKSHFFDILPQIIHTSLLYGDSIVEIDPTNSGIRHILHSPKNCTILYDEKTEIELGVIVQMGDGTSSILNMLSYSYPSISVSPPEELVAIISNNVVLSDFQEKRVESQITELLEDILKDSNIRYKYISPRRYVKFPIYYNNLYYPYGTSLYEPVRSIAKQLLLVEAALAIYRATRTPLRTIWGIEVGSTPEAEIPALINGIMDRIRRQKIIDPDNGTGTSIDSIPEMMTLEEDIWSPLINGQALIKADPVQTGDVNIYITDAEYFKKKLVASLGLPPAYLAEEQAAGTRALLTLEDIRFSRSIRKYQTDFNNGLNELANICFLLTGNAQYYNSVSINLPEPKTIEDNVRIENIANRLASADSLMQSFPNIPKLWVLKKMVGFTDDDIDEMMEMAKTQSELLIFNEQVPGKAGMEEGMGGMPGGGGGLDFDEGGIDMEGEFPEGDTDTLEGPLGDTSIEDLSEEEPEEEEADNL